MILITFAFTLAVLLASTYATHFLGGTITWRVADPAATGSPVSVIITQTYSWTWSIAQCSSSNIANGNSVPFSANFNGINNRLNCVAGCGTATGYVAPGIWPDCTDVSVVQGTTVGQRVDTVTVPRTANFTVAFASSAWRSLATHSAADWSIASDIDLTLRSDNGMFNTAPIATVMSPINIPRNQPKVIHIPIGDADGDPMRCRWASGTTECGDVCPPGSLPPNTILFPNCTIIITGQVIGDWFAVAVMVEDFIVSSSTTPLSSVPVQFLVQVVAPPSCVKPPDVYELSDKSCIPVRVGQTFTSRLIAINYCGSSVTIVDIATLSFSGMVQSSVIQFNSTAYYKTLTWTPQADQVGFQVMCAMAIDSQNSQSSQYCFTFYVTVAGSYYCPGDPTTTSTSSTSTSATTQTTTTQTTSTSTTSTTSTSTTSTSTTSTTTTTSTSTTTTTTSTSTTSTSTTSTTSTSTTSTSSTSTSSTSTVRPPVSITWPLIGGILGGLLLCTLAISGCLCWHCCCPPKWAILNENGPFELYHIDRCTDPHCQWTETMKSGYHHLLDDSRPDGTFSTLSDEILLSPLQLTMNSFLSFDEDFDRISVTKIRKTDREHSKMNTSIKSPVRRSDNENDSDETHRPPHPTSADHSFSRQGTVRVARIHSSKRYRPLSFNSTDGISLDDSSNVIRVTRPVSRRRDTLINSAPIARPSIVENTIHLDECETTTTTTSTKSQKKRKGTIRVKRIPTAHRKSGIEHRPSQVDTIELPTIISPILETTIEEEPTSKVRVEKRKKKNRTIVPFESVAEEPKDRPKSNSSFNVTVERILRTKSVEQHE